MNYINVFYINGLFGGHIGCPPHPDEWNMFGKSQPNFLHKPDCFFIY